MARVLVIANSASSLVNFRGLLLEEFVAHGHEVHAAGPSPDERTRVWLEARGVRYHNMDLERSGFSVSRDIKTIFALWGIMRQLRPDVFFAFTIKPVIYGVLVAASMGVKRRFALITGLGFAFIDGDRSPKRLIARLIASPLYALALRLATRVFFQNPDDARLFRDKLLLPRHGEPIIVNGSGIDIDHFAAAPVPNCPRFLMISRLVADKGVREFIEAARLVKKNHAEAVFDLVGPSDPNPSALPAKLIPDAERDSVIFYHGESKDVRPFLHAASVYVLPSYREGTPRSVLEAMATGRAVVTSDAPGCRETVVDGDNGFLVPVRDVAALARAMERLIEDPRLVERMGHRSREICEEKYDVRKVNAHMLRHMGLDG